MVRAAIGLIVVLLTSSGIAWGQGDEKPPAESVAAATPSLPETTEPRVTTVFALKYVPAADLSNALREVIDAGAATSTDVRIVAEPTGNRLIVIASAGNTKIVERLIGQLDRRPAMVVLQVMIAELRLHGTAASEAQGEASDAPATGDEPAESSPTGSDELKAKLKATGLDLTASADELAKQIRVLQQRGRLELLNHARLTTLDNQPAFLHVGERKPRVTGSATSPASPYNRTRPPARSVSVSYENVGLIIGVAPRVNADGVVTMEIEVEKSWLDDGDEVPPAEDSDADPVMRFPRVKTTKAQSTVSIPDGETVALGGLITRSGTQAEELVILVGANRRGVRPCFQVFESVGPWEESGRQSKACKQGLPPGVPP
ncbi:MAG: hypothetical protein HQ581_26585, partial [Planctomycetes bacterium]|nr:hypothetical protein [Planctomycetota bacterium]